MTQGYDEQHQTDAVAQKSDHSRGDDRRDSRKLAAHPQSKADIHRPGDETLQLDDLQWI
jgi:hypothetical protein